MCRRRHIQINDEHFAQAKHKTRLIGRLFLFTAYRAAPHMRGSLFYASGRNVTPLRSSPNDAHPLSPPTPGNLCIPHRLLTNSAFYPPLPLVLQALLSKKKAMGVVDTKKRSNLLSCFLVVGAEGFEPPTLCL